MSALARAVCCIALWLGIEIPSHSAFEIKISREEADIQAAGMNAGALNRGETDVVIQALISPDTSAPDFPYVDDESQLYFSNGDYKRLVTHLTAVIKRAETDLVRADAWALLGIVRFHEQNYPASSEAFEQALALRPENATFRYFLSVASLRAGKVGQADREMRVLIQSQPNVPRNHALLAVLALVVNDSTGAAGHLNRALALDPNDADLLHLRGLIRQLMGDDTAALEDFSRAIRLNDRLATWWNDRGVTQTRLGRVGDAMNDLDIALKLNPDYAAAYVNRGLIRYILRQDTAALSDFTRLCELFPGDWTVYTWRGNLFREMFRLDESIRDLTRAIDLHPSASNYYFRSMTHQYASRNADAFADISRAIRIDPAVAGYYRIRSSMHAALGRPNKAVDDLNTAIRIAPSAELHYARGVLFSQIGMLDRAEADFEVVIRLEPDKFLGYYTRGFIYLTKLNYESAILDFRRTLEIDTQFKEVYVNLGNCYVNLGHFDSGIDMYNAGLAAPHSIFVGSPEQARRVLISNRANAYRLSGRYEPAVMDFHASLESDSLNRNDLGNLADVFVRMGFADSAIAVMDRAILASPRDTDLITTRGSLKKDLGRMDEAEADYRLAVSIDPRSAIAIHDYGVLFSFQNRWEEAVAKYRESIRLIPEHPAFHTNLGHAYSKLGRYKDALKEHQTAIDLNPVRADAHYYRGNTYMHQNDHARAIENFSKAIELDPGYALAYNNRANSYRQIKKYDRALGDINESLRLRPAEALYHRHLASIYKDMGRHRDSMDVYTRMIENRMATPSDINERGNMHYELKDYASAAQDYRSAIKLNPSSCMYRYNLGLALEKSGEVGLSIDAFTATLACDSRHEDAHYSRGSAYYGLLQYDSALPDYLKAVEIDPEDAYNWKILGHTWAALKRDSDAIAAYSRAIKLKPDMNDAVQSRADAQRRLDAAQPSRRKAAPAKRTAAEQRADAAEALKNAMGHIRQNRFSPAMRWLDQAVASNPKLADAYSYRGYCRLKLDQFVEAMEDVDKAIRLDAKSAVHRFHRALCHRQMKNDSAALDDFDRALSLDSGYVAAHIGRAETLDGLGRHRAALESYNRAVVLNPNDGLTYKYRGHSRAAHGDTQGALLDYSKALEINPSDADAYMRRGYVHMKSDHADSAVQDFNAALKHLPSAVAAYNIYLSLAALYDGRGEYAKSLESYNFALKYNPRDKNILDQRARVRMKIDGK